MQQQRGRGTAKRGQFQRQHVIGGPRLPSPQGPYSQHNCDDSMPPSQPRPYNQHHRPPRDPRPPPPRGPYGQQPYEGPRQPPPQGPYNQQYHWDPRPPPPQGADMQHHYGQHAASYDRTHDRKQRCQPGEPYGVSTPGPRFYDSNSKDQGVHRGTAVQHHRGARSRNNHEPRKGAKCAGPYRGGAPWTQQFSRQHRRQGQGSQSGRSQGESLVEFKRSVNPDGAAAASEMSDVLSDTTSVSTTDGPAEGAKESTKPQRVPFQELEEMEDAVDEATPHPAPRTKAGFISVFWDIENCAVPKDVSASAIVKKVRDTFYKGLREADFVVACDIVKMKANVTEELNSAHVTVIHVSSERKNSADEKLRVRLRRFADLHQLSGSSIVLISGDVDFAAELHEMRYHNLIHVVLIHNEQAKKELIDVANESYKYTEFVSNLKVREVNTAAHSDKGPVRKAQSPKDTASLSTKIPQEPSNASPPLDTSKKSTVALKLRNKLGDLIFWKGYLLELVPTEFVLKVHQPDTLHLLYPSSAKAKKACSALERKAKDDAGAPICLGIVGKEKFPLVPSPMTTDKDKKEFSKTLQKAMTMHKSLVDSCQQQISDISGKGANYELKAKLEKQLSYYEDQLHEFLSVTNSVMHDCSAQGTSEKINAEVQHLRLAMPVYAVKSSLLQSIKERDVTLLSVFPGSGSGIDLATYLMNAGNPKTLIIKPSVVAAEGHAAYAKSVMGLKEVEWQVAPLNNSVSKSSVVLMTARCFFYEFLQCRRLLSDFRYIIVDDVQESCPYQRLVLLLLKQRFCGHAKIVLFVSALSQCSLIDNIFGEGTYSYMSCGVDFPVNVMWKPSGKDIVMCSVQEALSIISAESSTNKNCVDIVVFLSSTAEMILADALLKREVEKLSNLKDKVEHCYLREGSLIWNEPYSSKVWRVVFALRVSDISPLRPKYVIDCGTYEHFICRNGARIKQKLVVTPAEAAQRKAVAGTSPNGVCIRLYSPEALEAQLPLAVQWCSAEDILLRLMYREMDTTEYFLKIFPKECLDQSVDSLEMLGAIANGRVTAEGCKLCSLAVEPRLAKFVLEATKCMSLDDALAIALVAFEDISCAFYPLGPQGEQKKVASESGCAFTDVLTIYHEWLDVPKKGKPLWCKMNGINESFFRCLHRAVVKHRESIDARDYGTDSKRSVIGAKMLTSFPEGFCAKTPQGYTSQGMGKKLKVSQSSVVSLSVTPSHAVCCLFSIPVNAKKPQLLNFAPVDIGDVKPTSPNFSLSMQERQSTTGAAFKHSFTFGPIGSLIWNYQFADKSRLSLIEDTLRDSTGCTNVKIALNVERRSLSVHIAEKFHGIAASFLQHIVSEGVQNLSKKDIEICIDPSGIFKGSKALRVVLDGKGNATEVIPPGGFRTFKVTDMKISIHEFRNWINEFGRIVQYKVLKREEAFFITYKTTAEAEVAYVAMRDRQNDITAHVIPEEAEWHLRAADERRPVYRISLSAVRRQCTGNGFAVLENEASLDAIAYSLPYQCAYKDATIVCNRNKKEKAQLYISGIPAAAESDEIINLLNAVFPVKITSVRLTHEPPFETSISYADIIRDNVLQILGRKVLLEWWQPTPKQMNFTGIAFVDEVVQGHSVVKLAQESFLKTPRAAPSVPLKLRPILLETFVLPQDFFLLVKDEFQALLLDIQKGYHPQDKISLEVRAAGDGQPLVYVDIQSNNVNDFRKAVLAINEALHFEEVLKGQCAQEVTRYIDVLGLRETVFVDCKPGRVRLLGNLGKVAEAKAKVEEHAAKVTRGICKSLPLLANEATVMKSFMTEYGFTLEKFMDKCDLSKATVDLNEGKIIAFGSAASLKKAIKCLALLEVRHLAGGDQEHCPVCREVPDENSHRLESCGHIYCVRCLTWVICHAPLPLCCILEECGQEWVVMDIRSACHTEESVLALLGRKAFEECVLSNPSEWYCCPVPQCYYTCHYTQLSPAGKEAVCPVCSNAVCFWCNSLYHYGMSCDMVGALRSPGGFSEEQWVAQDPTCRRLCNGCGVALEQSGTERVVSCWRCSEFSCWSCRRQFQEPAAARAHTSC